MGKMKQTEVLQALGELLEFEEDGGKRDHYFELVDKVLDPEVMFKDWDSDEYTGSLEELDEQ